MQASLEADHAAAGVCMPHTQAVYALDTGPRPLKLGGTAISPTGTLHSHFSK